MPEWLYEAGIGEVRAALVADDRIIAAALEPDDTLTVGTVVEARLVELLPGRTGRVAFAGGEALLNAVPPGVTQGAAIRIKIVREAIPEAGRAKPPRAIVSDLDPCPGPDLLARIAASDFPVRQLRAHEPDALEAAGWSELLEEARTGDIAFPGGALRMSPTPAMTLFDVDGSPPLDTLALAAADAVSAAIVRHGIGGSIGIDFPTLSGKAQRQAIAAAIDAALPAPFERTAVNGFGFLQIVRPRPRASIPERIRADPAAAATRAALRSMERTPPSASRHHRLPAAIIACIDAHPEWRTELARRTGVSHHLEPLS